MAKSQMARQAGRQAPSDSTIATLAGRTTTAAATATRSEGLATGNNFTGQYLFDTFVGDTIKLEASKMDIVRQMVAALDTVSFKKVLGEFVGVAKGYYDNAVNEAKREGVYDADAPTPEMEQTSARLKTARNHQTVIRIAYGALKFAPDELAGHGGNGETGYHLMRVIGAKALAEKKINWDGTRAEPAETREARKAQDAETRTMLEIQRENPKKENEDPAHYLDRILKMTDKAMKVKQAEMHDEQVAALAKKVRELAGPLFDDVIDALMQPQVKPDVNLH